MPRIFEAIGKGIVGAGRAIRGGAAQATPAPAPMDEVPRPNADDTGTGRLGTKRNLLQKFGARIKRDAANAPVERGIRALRSRVTARRQAQRGGSR